MFMEYLTDYLHKANITNTAGRSPDSNEIQIPVDNKGSGNKGGGGIGEDGKPGTDKTLRCIKS